MQNQLYMLISFPKSFISVECRIAIISYEKYTEADEFLVDIDGVPKMNVMIMCPSCMEIA